MVVVQKTWHEIFHSNSELKKTLSCVLLPSLGKGRGRTQWLGKKSQLSIRLEMVESDLLSCKLTNVFKRGRGKNMLNVQIDNL